MSVSYEIKVTPTLWPSNSTSRNIHKRACTNMFLADLVDIVSNWKEPKCPSISEWVSCCLSTQWSTIQQYTGTAITQKNMVESQKNNIEWKKPDLDEYTLTIPFIWGSRTVKTKPQRLKLE